MRCACIICFRYGQANWEEKGGKRPHYSGRSGSRLKPYPTAGSCCFSLPSKSWDDQTMLGSFRRICLCASCFCCSLFPICPSDSLYVSVVSCLSLSSVSPGQLAGMFSGAFRRKTFISLNKIKYTMFLKQMLTTRMRKDRTHSHKSLPGLKIPARAPCRIR